MRTWRDASGIFVVQAELHELQPDIAKLRMEGGKLVEVRRDKLSQQDREYLADFEKKRNPFRVIESSESESTENTKPAAGKSTTPQKAISILPSLVNVKLFSPDKPLEKLESTHEPLLAIPTGQAFVDSAADGSRLSPILILDRKQAKVAISISPSIYSNLSLQPSRIYVGNLPNGPFKRVLESAAPLSLLDHCIETDQTLATGSQLGDSADHELILLEGLQAGELREVARFRLPVSEESNSRVSSARLTGKNRAVVVRDGVAYCWDLSAGEQLYQTDPRRLRRGFAEITFCDDRRMMLVPSGEGIHFVGTETAEDLGYLPLGNTYGMRFAFDPRSNRIAFCERDSLGIVNYSTLEQRPPQTTTLALSSKLFGWIAPNLILAGDGIVLDDQLGIPVWKYEAKWDSATIWENSVTIAQFDGGLKLQTMACPDGDLQAALAARPSIENFLATDTGTHVRLVLNLPETLPDDVNPNQLREQLQYLTTSAGWIADDSAPLQLVMSIAAGNKIKDLYQRYSPGFSNNEKIEVEITPMISRIELREGEKMIWAVQSQNDQPNRYGQSPYSKEEYIQQRERAIPEFFNNLKLPFRIARPPYSNGLGSSYAFNMLWHNRSTKRKLDEAAKP